MVGEDEGSEVVEVVEVAAIGSIEMVHATTRITTQIWGVILTNVSATAGRADHGTTTLSKRLIVENRRRGIAQENSEDGVYKDFPADRRSGILAGQADGRWERELSLEQMHGVDRQEREDGCGGWEGTLNHHQTPNCSNRDDWRQWHHERITKVLLLPRPWNVDYC